MITVLGVWTTPPQGPRAHLAFVAAGQFQTDEGGSRVRGLRHTVAGLSAMHPPKSVTNLSYLAGGAHTQ